MSETSVSTQDVQQTVYDLATSQADYPAWQGKPLRSILVCSHMRSGSTLLGETMYGLGGLGCPIEYFHCGFQPHLMQRWQASDFDSYHAAVSQHRTDPSGTLGVKLFWRDVEELYLQFHPEEHDSLRGESHDEPSLATYGRIHAMLCDLFPNPRFIYLYRSDRLRQAVSLAKATQTGVFRKIPGMSGARSPREFAYDYDQILKLLALGEHCDGRWRALFRSAGIDALQVRYEDLVADFPGTVSALLRQLGKGEIVVKSPRLQLQADRQSEDFTWRFLSEQRARVNK